MIKRATIDDVAALAGVHKGTVSRALNVATEHQVNAVTVRRIQRAAKQLGYVPNVMARSLRTNLSMTVGVIVPDLTNPIFPPILRGIESHLVDRGYTALVANTDGRESTESVAFESLLARRVDGFIVATGRQDHPFLSEAFERGTKIVLVNRGGSDAGYPLVTSDDAQGVSASVDHLVGLGHRSIVHLAGPASFSTSSVRRDAFLAAVARIPGLTHSIVETDAFSVAAGEEAMRELLRSEGERPTAIVAANDLLAVGALRTLRQSGLDCPGDISVIGFNDMPFAEDLNPALTTVRIMLNQMGVESARLLLEGISTGVQTPVSLKLPVSLIVRSSTGPAAS